MRRPGRVRLRGDTFVDDDGPFNPLGATLFWALWAEGAVPAKLATNLDFLSSTVDYVRVLGMVGAQPFWGDRVIDPTGTDYDAFARRLLARAGAAGVRVQVTLFADAQVMLPDADDRRRFVDRWAALWQAFPESILAFEIANEHWNNGFAGDRGVSRLRELGARLRDQVEAPVALSSPVEGRAGDIYGAPAPCDFATVHYPRERDGDPWRPVSRPWEWPSAFPGVAEGLRAVSNEPIGPRSSGGSDADPLRIVMSYIMALVSSNLAYVLHCGEGVRGIPDDPFPADVGGGSPIGRGENYDEAENIADILSGLRAAKAYLPAGLAGWSRREAGVPGFPFHGMAEAVGDGLATGAYATREPGTRRFVCAVLDHRARLEAWAEWDMRVRSVVPLTGQVLWTRHLTAGDRIELEAAHGASLLIGE